MVTVLARVKRRPVVKPDFDILPEFVGFRFANCSHAWYENDIDRPRLLQCDLYKPPDIPAVDARAGDLHGGAGHSYKQKQTE